MCNKPFRSVEPTYGNGIVQLEAYRQQSFGKCPRLEVVVPERQRTPLTGSVSRVRLFLDAKGGLVSVNAGAPVELLSALR